MVKTNGSNTEENENGNEEGQSIDITLDPQPGLSGLSYTFSVSPEVLIPLPYASRPARKVNRKKGKTVVLTESPYKNELTELLQTPQSLNMKICRLILIKVQS